MPIYIDETYVNKDNETRFGESGIIEPYTQDIGQLYKDLRAEYGRCTGHVYIGEGIPIGWVFEKRMEYDDTGRYGRAKEFYTREVWVSLAWKDDEEEELYSRYDVKHRKPVD